MSDIQGWSTLITLKKENSLSYCTTKEIGEENAFCVCP